MRGVTRIGGSNGHRFLSLNDYKRVIGAICEKNDWEFEPFRDYVFFDEQCFNIKDKHELKRKLECRKLPVSKINEYALEYQK